MKRTDITISFFHQIKDKYNNLSLPLKSSVWFAACSFMQRGISMLSTPIFTRLLSEAEYGKFGVFSSWSMVFEIILSLCLGSCAMILYGRSENKETILSALLSLQLFVGVFWLLIFIGLSAYLELVLGMPKILCICMLISVLSSEIIYLWMGYKRYNYEYKSYVAVTILNTLLSSILGIIAVVAVMPTAESRLIPATIINFLIAAILFIGIQKKNKVFYHKKIWQFAISFGIPLIPDAVSIYILSSSDRVMINYMCSSKDVALYSVANSVGTLVMYFTTAINASFLPYQYQQIQNKNYRHLAKRADQVMVLVAILLFGVMLLSREIIFVFGGRKYNESVDIILPICIGIFFSYLYQIFSHVQEYFLHKGALVISSVSCAILNLCLNLIFINFFGYKAAAYTTAFSYILFCYIHFLLYRKVIRKDLNGEKIYNTNNFAIISVFVILGGGIINILNRVLIVKYFILLFFLFLIIINHKKIKEILYQLKSME